MPYSNAGEPMLDASAPSSSRKPRSRELASPEPCSRCNAPQRPFNNWCWQGWFGPVINGHNVWTWEGAISYSRQSWRFGLVVGGFLGVVLTTAVVWLI